MISSDAPDQVEESKEENEEDVSNPSNGAEPPAELIFK